MFGKKVLIGHVRNYPNNYLSNQRKIFMADNHMKKYLAERVEEATKTEAFENEIKRTLRTEERFVNYFKQFDPESVESYIEYYAQQKAKWYQSANSYWHLKENRESQGYKNAIEAINFIAGKKVLNQMVQWLLGEAKFDGIDITNEWDVWLGNPLHFKYAETISQAEIDAFLSFINSLSEDEEYTKYQHLFSGTISLLNNEYENEEQYENYEWEYESYSRWCKYYDNLFQTPLLRKVPFDKREKECFYAFFKEKLEKANQPQAPAAPYDNLKFIDYDYQKSLIVRYVKEYETYENKMAFEGYKWSKERRSFLDRTESIMYKLEDIEEYVPVSPNDDWRKGLEIALDMNKRSKIVEALPAAYEEYLYRIEHQLGFEDWLEFQGTLNEENEYIQQFKARILEGRKLLNEPENFDF